MPTLQEIVDNAADIGGKYTFTKKTSSSGNYRLECDIETPPKGMTKAEAQVRNLLGLIDSSREAGIEASFQLAFKGNDGSWFNKPHIWINVNPKTERVEKSDQDKDAEIAALKAQLQEQLSKPAEAKAETKVSKGKSKKVETTEVAADEVPF